MIKDIASNDTIKNTSQTTFTSTNPSTNIQNNTSLQNSNVKSNNGASNVININGYNQNYNPNNSFISPVERSLQRTINYYINVVSF